MNAENKHRIRRTASLPLFAAQEKHRRHTKRIHTSRAAIGLRYRISRLENFGYRDDRIKSRELFSWYIKGNKKVGAFEFKEYFPENCFDNDDFLEVMDFNEAHEHEMSVALCSVWNDIVTDVAGYGSILEFRNAWIAPGTSRRDLLARLGNIVIDHAFNRYAILVMKAFPLEYEGVVTDQNELAFGHRQRAMLRYYRHCFGVHPLPGWAGEKGWLWRPNPKLAKHVAPTISESELT